MILKNYLVILSLVELVTSIFVISDFNITILISFPYFFVNTSDFSNLSVGDIIRLDTNVESAIDIYVGNIRKFTAVAGASNDKYAVKVTSVIREED